MTMIIKVITNYSVNRKEWVKMVQIYNYLLQIPIQPFRGAPKKPSINFKKKKKKKKEMVKFTSKFT